MGMYDRDYYRDLLNKRDGYTEKAKFRVSLASRPLSISIGQWHPVLLAALFAAICGGVFGLLKLISIFAK